MGCTPIRGRNLSPNTTASIKTLLKPRTILQRQEEIAHQMRRFKALSPKRLKMAEMSKLMLVHSAIILLYLSLYRCDGRNNQQATTRQPTIYPACAVSVYVTRWQCVQHISSRASCNRNFIKNCTIFIAPKRHLVQLF
jgi:hypothetical protein